MKLLKVNYTNVAGDGVTHLVYPPEYVAEKFQVICYKDGSDAELVGWVHDKDADGFLASEKITELTPEEAKTLLGSTGWISQTEKITDQNKVISVLAKVARSETLTQEDYDIINPDHATMGINKSKSADEIIDELVSRNIT